MKGHPVSGLSSTGCGSFEEMKLTAYQGKGRAGGSKGRSAPTTTPGWVNTRGQEVVERTGSASATFPGQVVYRLRCRQCAHEYGANGIDVKARTCPKCQGGAKGEPLVERPLGLFS
jgi:hypothetical protein